MVARTRRSESSKSVSWLRVRNLMVSADCTVYQVPILRAYQPDTSYQYLLPRVRVTFYLACDVLCVACVVYRLPWRCYLCRVGHIVDV